MKRKIIANIIIGSVVMIFALCNIFVSLKKVRASVGYDFVTTYASYLTQGTRTRTQPDVGGNTVNYNNQLAVPLAWAVSTADSDGNFLSHEYWIPTLLYTPLASAAGSTRNRDDARIYFDGLARPAIVSGGNWTVIDERYLRNNDLAAGALNMLRLQFSSYSHSTERSCGEDATMWMNDDGSNYPNSWCWGVGEEDQLRAQDAINTLKAGDMTPGGWIIKVDLP